MSGFDFGSLAYELRQVALALALVQEHQNEELPDKKRDGGDYRVICEVYCSRAPMWNACANAAHSELLRCIKEVEEAARGSAGLAQ